MKKLPFYVLSLVASLLCVYFLTKGSLLLWENPDYVSSLNLPADSDSVGLAVIGTLLTEVFLYFFIGLVYLILLFYVLGNRRLHHIDLKLFLPQKGQTGVNVVKYPTLLGLMLFLVNHARSFLHFPADAQLHLGLFYLTLVFSILAFLVWLTLFFAPHV